MKEIAVRVGFSSAQNLARFFQKEKRMSMSAFRRQSVWERQNDRELQAIRSSHTA
jgi:AraC-like DNA-binding protein